ncbi:MAG TPA: cation transporter [Smithellaceae bacterium]|nr:cation transporter [Smithellaceae bacterium]HRV44535.1 cation transporter [Smithellaceae bacterium]
MNTKPTPATPADHDYRVYRMVLWSYITVLPAAALFLLTAPITDSMALYVNLAWYSVSFAVQTFSVYAMRQSLHKNPARFTYGTGKLENFSAFLDGVLCIPTGLYMAATAAGHLIEPVPVGYALGMVPVILTGIRLGYFFMVCYRLERETGAPSPILHSGTVSFRVAFLSNLGMLVAFLTGWALIRSGLPEIGNRVDPAIALVMSLYMIIAGSVLVWDNFRSLMDLPLTEDEQLHVMKVLATFYDNYDGIGTIYTRTSGKEQFVELELFFPASITLEEIRALQEEMEKALAGELPGLRFRIIPEVRT